MNGLTVSELAQRAGTSADTVRYYERIGLLPEPRRSDSGYRLYDDPAVERLQFIKESQRFGLKLEEIGELLEVRDHGMCPCGHSRHLLERRIEDIDEQVTALTQLRAAIDGMLNGLHVRDGGTWPCEPQLIQIEDRRSKTTRSN